MSSNRKPFSSSVFKMLFLSQCARCIWKTERCLEAGDRVVDLGTGGLPSPPPAAKKLQSDDADLSGALVSAKLPRIKLSTDIMERLRHLVKRQPLRLRASIK